MNMNSDNEWYKELTDQELKFMRKRMKDNYLRVKRINFKISESYLKDLRFMEKILLDRYYEKALIQKRIDKIKQSKRYGKKRYFIK